jgi:hypothetical protein
MQPGHFSGPFSCLLRNRACDPSVASSFNEVQIPPRGGAYAGQASLPCPSALKGLSSSLEDARLLDCHCSTSSRAKMLLGPDFLMFSLSSFFFQA